MVFFSVMDTSTINCIYSKQLILLEKHEVNRGRKRKIWLLLLTFFYLLHNLINYKVYLLFKVSHNSSSHNMKRVTNKVDLPPDFQEWIRFFCSSNIILLNMKKWSNTNYIYSLLQMLRTVTLITVNLFVFLTPLECKKRHIMNIWKVLGDEVLFL